MTAAAAARACPKHRDRQTAVEELLQADFNGSSYRERRARPRDAGRAHRRALGVPDRRVGGAWGAPALTLARRPIGRAARRLAAVRRARGAHVRARVAA